MSRKADHEEAHRRHDVFTAVDCHLALHDLAMFNNDAYQKHASLSRDWLSSQEKTAGLFYSFTSLDHSDSSMLVSAGFEGHHPLTN